MMQAPTGRRRLRVEARPGAAEGSARPMRLCYLPDARSVCFRVAPRGEQTDFQGGCIGSINNVVPVGISVDVEAIRQVSDCAHAATSRAAARETRVTGFCIPATQAAGQHV